MTAPTVTRRRALQLMSGSAAAAGAAAVSPTTAGASPALPREDAIAMLYDTTRCIGCKACMVECNTVNGLEPDTTMSGGIWQLPLTLNARTKNIIQYYKDEATGAQSFVKHQCMHCVDPACVAGCPFSALHKGEKGVVTWDESKCIGCRFCEVACPFEVPKFEWDRFNPKIVKCEFCAPRLAEGLEPGCTAVCPTDAVIFGTRTALLADAKSRLAQAPDRYHEGRVYGETDGGGTQVLYLSHVPFEAIGLPTLPQTSNAQFATKYQSLLYKAMIAPALLYALLAGIIRRRWRAHDEHAREEMERGGLRDQL
jgi:formate dehydrogenase beta subunit